MLRQAYLLIFVLIFIASDTALGARRGKCRRLWRCHSCAQANCSTGAIRTDFPQYCLRRRYLNYPGPYDLYECLTYVSSCNDTPIGELWYGSPSKLWPQDCDPGLNSCEYDAWGGKHVSNGHDLMLNTRGKAWKMIDAGLTGAGISVNPSQALHDVIPQSQVTPFGIHRDVRIIIVPIPGPGTTTRYLALETDVPDAVPTQSYRVSHRPGSGRQLTIEFRVGAIDRVGLVWLKE